MSDKNRVKPSDATYLPNKIIWKSTPRKILVVVEADRYDWSISRGSIWCAVSGSTACRTTSTSPLASKALPSVAGVDIAISDSPPGFPVGMGGVAPTVRFTDIICREPSLPSGDPRQYGALISLLQSSYQLTEQLDTSVLAYFPATAPIQCKRRTWHKAEESDLAVIGWAIIRQSDLLKRRRGRVSSTPRLSV